jgi:hypothetical protein
MSSHVSADSFSLQVPPGSLHVMVFMAAFLLIPGAARPGLGTLRSIEVSLRRLAEPASTSGSDCPPIRRQRNRQNLFENHNPC